MTQQHWEMFKGVSQRMGNKSGGTPTIVPFLLESGLLGVASSEMSHLHLSRNHHG